jgi:hypothetical protein
MQPGTTLTGENPCERNTEAEKKEIKAGRIPAAKLMDIKPFKLSVESAPSPTQTVASAPAMH